MKLGEAQDGEKRPGYEGGERYCQLLENLLLLSADGVLCMKLVSDINTEVRFAPSLFSFCMPKTLR